MENQKLPELERLKGSTCSNNLLLSLVKSEGRGMQRSPIFYSKMARRDGIKIFPHKPKREYEDQKSPAGSDRWSGLSGILPYTAANQFLWKTTRKDILCRVTLSSLISVDLLWGSPGSINEKFDIR